MSFRLAPPPRRAKTLRGSRLRKRSLRSLLRRGKLLRSPLAAFLIFAVPAALDACPICFQFEQGPVTAGMRGAVFVLMGVTAGVLTGFAVFMTRFVRRARQ